MSDMRLYDMRLYRAYLAAHQATSDMLVADALVRYGNRKLDDFLMQRAKKDLTEALQVVTEFADATHKLASNS